MKHYRIEMNVTINDDGAERFEKEVADSVVDIANGEVTILDDDTTLDAFVITSTDSGTVVAQWKSDVSAQG